MGFQDLLRQEQEELQKNQGGDKVKFPEPKHKRVFFNKENPEYFLQILPGATENDWFAVALRKIFLTAQKSDGSQWKTNFVLADTPDEDSHLENKIQEWIDNKLLTNQFGSQNTPSRKHLVNACILTFDGNQNKFVREVDNQGNIVVRMVELPHSAYAKIIKAMQDPMMNAEGKPFSFLQPEAGNPIKVSQPKGKNEMAYDVQVYTNFTLDPLPNDWVNHLEDLNEHATPTEKLENGQGLVDAFIDIKEGRKPNQNKNKEEAPQSNPYAEQGNNAPPTQPDPPQQQQTPPQTPPAQGQSSGYGGYTPQQPQTPPAQGQGDGLPTPPEQPNTPPASPEAPPEQQNKVNTQSSSGNKSLDDMINDELNN